MNERSDIRPENEIVAEASAWVAQLDSGNLSGADLAALREWMARSPAHAYELRTLAKFSGDLSILTELAEPLSQATAANSKLRKPQWRKAFAVPSLAAAALILIVGAISLFALFPAHEASTHIYRTAVGEYQTVELDDGSSIKLNTDSQLEIDYSDTERRVRLVHGEALFDVMSDPARPFIVYSDSATATAIGTSFVVRLKGAVTELAVVEGAVSFSKLPDTIAIAAQVEQTQQVESPATHSIAQLKPVIVKAGQALSSTDISKEAAPLKATAIPTIPERDIMRKLSWTEGLFDFSQTPLSEVVYEVTRHNNVSIEIVDPSLEDLKFGGIFRTGDVDQLLEALEGLGVAVERQEGNLILLSKA